MEDLVGVGGEEGALGAGEVVLGEGGDLLEEAGAGGVVEEPGGEGFWRGGEAATGLGGDGVGSGDWRRFQGRGVRGHWGLSGWDDLVSMLDARGTGQDRLKEQGTGNREQEQGTGKTNTEILSPSTALRAQNDEPGWVRMTTGS